MNRRDPLLKTALLIHKRLSRNAQATPQSLSRTLAGLLEDQQTLQRYWRQLARAEQKRWHLAAQHLRNQIFQQIQTIRYRLAELPARSPTPQPLSLRFVWEELNQLRDDFEQVEIRLLAALVTHRVQVADVQITRLAGHTGSAEVALIVKGEFLLSVDLEKARFESVDERNRTAVLVLPAPELLSVKLDHQRTRIFALQESGLWRIAPGDQAKIAALEEGFREAEAMLRAAGADPQLRTRSRQQAKQVLKAFMSAVGWEVQVRWVDA